MADQKLTQLPALAALTADDIFYVVNDPAGAAQSRKIAASVFDARYLQAANNLSDLTNVAVARASLGLGTLAVINSPLPIINGGSGQVTQQAAIDALTNVAAATNEHVLTKDTGTGNAIYKAVTVLPVVDETALVYKTGVPANTLTFDVSAYTAARVATWPDAALTVAGLEVPNVFTAIQKINTNSALALLVEQDGVKDNVLVVDTSTGRVGINRTPGIISLDVMDANGAIRVTDTVADATLKRGRLLVPNYNNADGSVVIFGALNGTANQIGFGGGLTSFNTATQIAFYSAATTTTKTGTEIVRITTAGLRVEPSGIAAVAAAPLHVKQTSTTGAVPVVRIEQLDVSEEFIRFIGTSANGVLTQSIVENADVGAATLQGWLKLYVQDDGNQLADGPYFTPFYSLA